MSGTSVITSPPSTHKMASKFGLLNVVGKCVGPWIASSGDEQEGGVQILGVPGAEVQCETYNGPTMATCSRYRFSRLDEGLNPISVMVLCG